MPLEAPLPVRPAYGIRLRVPSLRGAGGVERLPWELIGDLREDGVATDAAVYASAMRALVAEGGGSRDD